MYILVNVAYVWFIPVVDDNWVVIIGRVLHVLLKGSVWLERMAVLLLGDWLCYFLQVQFFQKTTHSKIVWIRLSMTAEFWCKLARWQNVSIPNNTFRQQHGEPDTWQWGIKFASMEETCTHLSLKYIQRGLLFWLYW